MCKQFPKEDIKAKRFLPIVFLQKIDPDLKNIMDYKMPKLIIQPFIENAIKHGLKDMTKDFVITLHVFCTQSRLIISMYSLEYVFQLNTCVHNANVVS